MISVSYTHLDVYKRQFEWIGLIAICFILPAVISWAVCALMRKAGAIDEGDLKLED